MSENSLVLDLMAQFNRARTMSDYRQAKRRVEKLLGTEGILAMVDTMIDARTRIQAGGAL